MIKIGDARPAVGHERRAGLVRVPGRRALHERAVWARHLCAEETFVVGNAGRVSDSRKKQKKKRKAFTPSRAKSFGAFRYVGRVTRTETGRTHVHGFEPPVADGLEAELHGLLIPQAAEPLAVDVALVHEDVPFAVVSRHEACDWERHKASVV